MSAGQDNLRMSASFGRQGAVKAKDEPSLSGSFTFTKQLAGQGNHHAGSQLAMQRRSEGNVALLTRRPSFGAQNSRSLDAGVRGGLSNSGFDVPSDNGSGAGGGRGGGGLSTIRASSLGAAGDGILTGMAQGGQGPARLSSTSRSGSALRPTSASSRPGSAQRLTSQSNDAGWRDSHSGGAAFSSIGSGSCSNSEGVGSGHGYNSFDGRSNAKLTLSARLAETRATFKAQANGGRGMGRDTMMMLKGGTGATRPASPGMKSHAGGHPDPPPRQEGQRPRGYTCYLCGAQFGSQSLHIHIAACQKKWEMKEAAKLPRERRRVPPPPPEIASGTALPLDPRGIDEFNCSMSDYWSRVSLVGCPICGRTFREDAFEKHRNVCTPDAPGGPLGPGRNMPLPQTAAGARPPSGGRGRGRPPPRAGNGGANYDARPRAYMCYLCGSQYGSTSLAIHIPQCYEKWLKVEAGKPPKERREPPPPPEELDHPLPTAPEEIDAFNSRMSGVYNGSSLMPCRNCGRTFRPEALARHQNACTADNPMKATNAGGNGLGGGGGGGRIANLPGGGGEGHGSAAGEHPDAEQQLEQCQHCQRRMRPEALGKHQKVCTAAKPMKGINRTPAAATGGNGDNAGASPPRTPAPPADHLSGTGRRPLRQPGASIVNGASPTGCVGGATSHSPSQLQHGHDDGWKHEEGRQYNADDDGGQHDDSSSTQHINGDQQHNGRGYQAPDDAGDISQGDFMECGSCGRRFAPHAYQVHSRVCAKVNRPRKAFNAAAHRVKGTDAAQFVGRPKSAAPRSNGEHGRGRGMDATGSASVRTVTSPGAVARPASRSGAGGEGGSRGSGAAKPAWQQQSEALRSAMAAQRKIAQAIASGKDLRDIPYVPSGPDPGSVHCPHCGRHYSQKAAERHIPACAGTVNKPKFLKRGTGGAGKGAPDSKPLPQYY